jgi:hypothetical protein
MGAVTVKAHPAHQPAHRSEVGKVTFHTIFPNSNVEKLHSEPFDDLNLTFFGFENPIIFHAANA